MERFQIRPFTILMSPDIAKLSSENSLENQSQMALPSLSKRGFDEALWLGVGQGTLLFMILVPTASATSFHDPTSR
jgi:hypothetical protein